MTTSYLSTWLTALSAKTSFWMGRLDTRKVRTAVVKPAGVPSILPKVNVALGLGTSVWVWNVLGGKCSDTGCNKYYSESVNTTPTACQFRNLLELRLQ